MPVNNLPLQRRLTKWFIDENPVTLVIVPRERTKKPAGGWVWTEGAPRPPQVFTVIEPNQQPQPVVTADGVERTVDFTIIGEYNASISRGDVFSLQGKEWEVVELFFDNEYERRALVSARG